MTVQPELFENGATPYMVRRVHPNSAQAYHDAAPELSKRAADVLAVYRRATHPITDREVKDVLGFADMNAVRPRITELIESGLLRECGRIKDDATRKMVRVVEVAGSVAMSEAAPHCASAKRPPSNQAEGRR